MEVKPNGVNGLVLGAYRTAQLSGATSALAAGDAWFAFQWAPASDARNPLCAITRLKIFAQIITPFTAAQEIAASATIARGFTAPAAGGNALTLTGNNAKLRTASGISQVADARVSSGTALTPGTWTLDASPITRCDGAQLLAAASAAFVPISSEFWAANLSQYPLILANQEGFVARNDIAQGAGGTVKFGIELEWLEFLPLPS